MLEARIKRLPIRRGRTVVGVVSRHDLLKALALDDADIERGVRGARAEEGRRMARLGVRVRNGVAELSGEPDRRVLRVAEVVARAVPGVLDVRPTGHAS